jgi:hypothetical protein
LTMPHFCACPKPRTLISNAICCGLFFLRFRDLRREVTVCFVDIGRIVDHHCLNFLFQIIVMII